MLKIVKKLEVLMKYFVPNEVFSIRKLKVGTCSVLLAISILGSQGILSDEVVTSSSPMATKESSNAITNDLDNSPTVNQNRSAEMIASNSTTNGLDNSLSVNSISSNGTIRSNSQLDNRTVESTVTSTNENKSYKEDVISDRIIKKEFEDTALSVKDYGAVGDGIHDDRQAIQDAIDAAAQGLGGGNVYFPEGTYLVKEIVFLKSHTHLELNEKATILNGINIKNHPSIVFMTGLFTDDGAQVEWGPIEDISYSGGTIDMNGALNEEGTKAKNLPLINSSGAFAIGNSNNVTIKNVTFKDSYQGHAIQIAGSKNVLVDNSRFLGQALPKTMKDGQIISKESIQIEPLTRKGFPYALNDDGKKSENVTIQNSYFGKSDKSGELVTAIGTHYQTLSTQNPSNIKILNNHFDNMMYAGVRFTGFTDVLIKGNRFDKKVKGESVHYRENGAALVNAYSYKNTKDLLDLNKQVVIAENIFNIADPKTKAIRVAKDSAEYLGKVSDITVTKNVINNNSKETEQPNIELLRVSDNLVVSENSIFGGKEGIVIEDSKGKITVLNNQFYNLSGKYISVIKSNANGKEPVIRDSDGNFNIVTNNLSDKNEKEKNKEEKQSNSNNVIDSNQKNGEFNSSKDNRQMNDKIDNKQYNKTEEVNYKIV
ncbi:multi-ligand-binding adhesin PfbA, partial [Streptococcus pneumoniae]|uniref:multi-ligand-binding adhesin PfbA n=1 Tax=Streptococcus pneumoniae TaxID=1313 RepID=UPI000F65133A